MVGIVVPLYLTKFIDSIIENLKETTKAVKVVFCFVNDGKEEIKKHFEDLQLPENMVVYHKGENEGFAKANNSGWKYLLSLYPDLEYLGTLNDDTIPHEGWLEAMINSIEKDESYGAVVPNVREFENGVEGPSYATFEFLNDPLNPMRATNKQVEVDTLSKAMSGCCFVCRAKVLKAMDFFDEKFLNGCEDVDLSLNLLVEGFKIVASGKATITHLGGSSRLTKPSISEDIMFSTEVLALKWTSNYAYYNDYIRAE